MTDTTGTVPISSLFFDGPGPHVIRAGYAPREQAPARNPTYTPARGHELKALLKTSIVQLGAVSGDARRRTPVRSPVAVDIESLLYRGPAALKRALEIREKIISQGTAEPGELLGEQLGELLGELLDLIALAATE